MDYALLGTSVTLAIGAATVTNTITPLQDQLQEPNETVTVSLTQGPKLQRGLPEQRHHHHHERG